MLNKTILYIFIPFIFTGCSFLNKEVDASLYKLHVPDIKSHLYKQKNIVVYDPIEHTLIELYFYKRNNKLMQINEILFPIESEFIFGPYGNLYFHRLSRIGCRIDNIEKCIKRNLMSEDIYYQQPDGNKAYLLKKEFGRELFDTIDEYKGYLKKIE